jgi:hypothetical protein
LADLETKTRYLDFSLPPLDIHIPPLLASSLLLLVFGLNSIAVGLDRPGRRKKRESKNVG